MDCIFHSREEAQNLLARCRRRPTIWLDDSCIFAQDDSAQATTRNSAMFATFFHELKAAGLPVTLREYLTLIEAMEMDLAGRSVESFYYLSRAALVKDERNLDKFERVFGHVFKGLDLIEDALTAEIPIEWLKKLTEKYLTEEEKKQIEAMGGLEKLLE